MYYIALLMITFFVILSGITLMLPFKISRDLIERVEEDEIFYISAVFGTLMVFALCFTAFGYILWTIIPYFVGWLS